MSWRKFWVFGGEQWHFMLRVGKRGMCVLSARISIGCMVVLALSFVLEIENMFGEFLK